MQEAPNISELASTISFGPSNSVIKNELFKRKNQKS